MGRFPTSEAGKHVYFTDEDEKEPGVLMAELWEYDVLKAKGRLIKKHRDVSEVIYELVNEMEPKETFRLYQPIGNEATAGNFTKWENWSKRLATCAFRELSDVTDFLDGFIGEKGCFSKMFENEGSKFKFTITTSAVASSLSHTMEQLSVVGAPEAEATIITEEYLYRNGALNVKVECSGDGKETLILCLDGASWSDPQVLNIKGVNTENQRVAAAVQFQNKKKFVSWQEETPRLRKASPP
eukprot:GHVS01002877.1.p1 GENE.GHVS01002877.1~~GHVS01002877.1.p1  ORF type:complete len:241 (+),score=18.38 GHVS01002877.1:1183-1905(+)